MTERRSAGEDDPPGVRIVKAREARGIDRGGGIVSFPIADQLTGASKLLVGVTELPPGASIPWHTHDAEECVVVLVGRAALDTGDGRTDLAPFDATLVPSDTPHRFANIGKRPARILWIYPDQHTRRTLTGSGRVLGHLDRYDT